MDKTIKNETLKLIKEVQSLNSKQMMLADKADALFGKMEDEEMFEEDIYSLLDSLDILLYSHVRELSIHLLKLLDSNIFKQTEDNAVLQA